MIEQTSPILTIMLLERRGQITKEEGEKMIKAYLERIGARRWRISKKCDNSQFVIEDED